MQQKEFPQIPQKVDNLFSENQGICKRTFSIFFLRSPQCENSSQKKPTRKLAPNIKDI
jgi:hypothetical protein